MFIHFRGYLKVCCNSDEDNHCQKRLHVDLLQQAAYSAILCVCMCVCEGTENILLFLFITQNYKMCSILTYKTANNFELK